MVFLDIGESSISINRDVVLSPSVSVTVDDSRLDVPSQYLFSEKDVSKIPEEILVPLRCLKGKSALQAIVYYLKSQNFRFCEISKMLNRDQRTIWATYNSAEKTSEQSKRHEETCQEISCDISSSIGAVPVNSNAQVSVLYSDVERYIPLSVFFSRELSVLESIVFYLKNSCDMDFEHIARSLGKNYQTIWTVYRRAMKKIA